MATAFIGLDFINDIVHPEGKISHTADLAAERGIIEKVNRALATAREKGMANNSGESWLCQRLYRSAKALAVLWTSPRDWGTRGAIFRYGLSPRAQGRACGPGDCETPHQRLLWHTTGCGIAGTQG